MNILIVDDHAIFRRGLRDTLAAMLPDCSFGEAASALESLDWVRRSRWDVLILDISLPGKSGLEAIPDLKTACPSMRILVLSAHSENLYATRAFQAGASGFLCKSDPPSEVVSAVRKVLAGERYVSPMLTDPGKLLQELGHLSERPGVEALSERELQVLRLLAAGKSAKQIAGELSLRVQTVSTYRSRVLQKLRMSTTAEIIRYAIEHKLAD